MSEVDMYNNIANKCYDYTKLKKENELLKEHIKDLENDINRLYYTMISLKAIATEENVKLEDIEEI